MHISSLRCGLIVFKNFQQLREFSVILKITGRQPLLQYIRPWYLYVFAKYIPYNKCMLMLSHESRSYHRLIKSLSPFHSRLTVTHRRADRRTLLE